MSLLDTRQAAQVLGLSHRTLERWRLEGQGPMYVKLGGANGRGAVRYRQEDLDSWVEARIRRSSSDPGEMAAQAGQ